MDQEMHLENDEYLTLIKEAKNSRSVIKLSFATFASSIPENIKIFAMEGVDDKVAYFHWVRQINTNINYESYICKNKTNTLKLFDALQSDLTGLGERVYYFIDKDYDNYQGREPHQKIYMTEKYSIENFIVCAELLNDLLILEFHMNGQNETRQKINETFERLYGKFLEITSAINFRIFLARKLGIRQRDDLPKNCTSFVSISSENVTALDVNVHDLVQLEREPTIAEENHLLSEFNSLQPQHDYRGKFALSFFSTWLNYLRTERMADNSIYFQNTPRSEFNISGDFSFGRMISKSKAPNNLHEFLANI